MRVYRASRDTQFIRHLPSQPSDMLQEKTQMQFQPPPGPPPHMRAAPPVMPIGSIPMMMITSTEVRSAQTNTPIFAISKSSARASLSGKSFLTLVRPVTGQMLGTIRYHSTLSESIELTVNGRITKLKQDSSFNFRYYFHPTFDPRLQWWWSEKKGDLRLKDGKDGPVIAIVSGNILACEQDLGLTSEMVDEIVVSAVAALRKNGKMKEENEVAGEVISAVLGAS